MKKYLLFAMAVLLVAAHSSAQYKPKKGSISTEIQFNPFDQDGEMFKLDGVKVRYFFTDNDALRVKLGFNMQHANSSMTDSDRNENTPNASYHDNENKFKSTTGSLELNLGYEHHFAIAKRLSAYVGASVGFNRHFASTKINSTDYFHNLVNDRWQVSTSSFTDIEITNGAFSSLPDNLEGDLLGKVNNRAYWGVQAAAFTGIDFYVYKGLYLGTELGLGVNSTKSSKMKYRETSENEKEIIESETKDNVRSTTFRFYIEPVLRLGWSF